MSIEDEMKNRRVEATPVLGQYMAFVNEDGIRGCELQNEIPGQGKGPIYNVDQDKDTAVAAEKTANRFGMSAEPVGGDTPWIYKLVARKSE